MGSKLSFSLPQFFFALRVVRTQDGCGEMYTTDYHLPRMTYYGALVTLEGIGKLGTGLLALSHNQLAVAPDLPAEPWPLICLGAGMSLFGACCITIASRRHTGCSKAAIRGQSRAFCAISGIAFFGGLGLQLSAMDAADLRSATQPTFAFMFTFNTVYMLCYLEMATQAVDPAQRHTITGVHTAGLQLDDKCGAD